MKSKKTSSKKSNQRPRVSVIIPTFNSWSTLKDCLKSIQKQTVRPFEILVIDNASTDKTSTMLQKLANSKTLKLKITRNKKNLGVTGGRNRGIKEASKKTDYFLFFDHDMIAADNMLEELLKISESLSDVGIVTPKIYYWEGEKSLGSKKGKKRIWAAGTNINLWTGRVIFRGGEDLGQYDKVEEVEVAPAAMLVKNSVIKSIGIFDNRYFATYEDTDFCFRAREKGFKTIYVPRAISYHNISQKHPDERKRLLGRSYWIGRNRILFMRKFAKNFYVFLLFSPIYLVYFIKLSFQDGNFMGLANYLKGYWDGLFNK